MKGRSAELLWLALVYRFHHKPAPIISLIEVVDDIGELFTLTPEEAASYIGASAEAVIASMRSFDQWQRCEDDARLCKQMGIEMITYSDERYPPLLRMIHDPPVVLFVRGDISVLHAQPCVALVGARKATRAGRIVAHQLARDLARAGWVVVSGMAYGIDRAAHEGALEGGGKTVTVWGSGADVVYPRAHRILAEQIMAQGTAITEFPLGTIPDRYHFPQRNRIISGVSLGVVVVEAAESSGSLITARCALEQGRDVCALPWGAGLVMGRGVNGLIKQGAALVENARDVVRTLSGATPHLCERKKSRQAKAYAATEAQPSTCDFVIEGDPILTCLVGGENTLDGIIAACGIDAAWVLNRITQLEMDGLIEELPGKRYKLRGD